jgi:gluconolactonase
VATPVHAVNLDVRAARLAEIVAPHALLEPLAGGFQFLEGLVWLAGERALIFSDIPGDTIYRWDTTGGVAVYRQPSRKANGNTLDQQGRLLTCEHATSRVVRQDSNDTLTALASHYAGLELNSPNDIVVKGDGAIYFTDPNFGRRPTRHGVPRAQEQPCQGVFRLDPRAGVLARLVDDFDQPNGLCFSLDERRLFVNDSPRGHIRAFAVREDGTLAGGEIWAELRGEGPGVPDGMKLDAAGNLYCAGPGGIHVFDARAACLGVIRLPEQAANFCWGGDDLRDLLIGASTTLYRVRVQVAGRLAGGAGLD